LAHKSPKLKQKELLLPERLKTATKYTIMREKIAMSAKDGGYRVWQMNKRIINGLMTQ
jgi:hypothetical protein